MPKTEDTLMLHIDVLIFKVGPCSEQLRVHEEVAVGPMGFMEVAQVLGQFHELAQRIKAAAK